MAGFRAGAGIERNEIDYDAAYRIDYDPEDKENDFITSLEGQGYLG